MLAASSGLARDTAAPVQRRSVAAAIGRGLLIGVAATVLQALILLALLYGSGIIGT